MGWAPQRYAERAAVVRAPSWLPTLGMRADQRADGQEVVVVENHRPVDARHFDQPPLSLQRAGLAGPRRCPRSNGGSAPGRTRPQGRPWPLRSPSP